jgi:hypothetical protein
LRKKLIAILGAVVALAVVATTAYGAVSIVFTANASPAKAGKSTGLKVNFTVSEPGQPQPPILNRVVIKLQTGGKYNSSKYPRCNLASLQAKGPNACPSKSRIGTGTGIGRALPVVEDPVNGKLTLFNGSKSGGKDTVLVYVFPDLGPTFVVVCKITKKVSGNFDYTLDCSIPPIKTLPSAPDASVVETKTTTKRATIRKGKRKYPLIVAPKKCSGTWKAEAQFFFQTGETAKTPYSGKCSK